MLKAGQRVVVVVEVVVVVVRGSSKCSQPTAKIKAIIPRKISIFFIKMVPFFVCPNVSTRIELFQRETEKALRFLSGQAKRLSFLRRFFLFKKQLRSG
jgi:hypothetical protein